MFACTTDKYAELYARWLAHAEDLLLFAELQPGERVLDLCGGTGVVAVKALRRGASSATLLDLNPRCKDPGVIAYCGRAEEVDNLLRGQKFDIIVCRQAIGYLDLGDTMRAVSKIVAPSGRFAFNAFRRPRWGLKFYRHAGKRFIEASAYLGRRVFHVQASPGLGVDVTMFRWHTEAELHKAAARHFGDVRIDRGLRTLRFVCRRPREYVEDPYVIRL
jgi:predicted TPR repeat methyltransferase